VRSQVTPLNPKYSYRRAARSLAFAQFPLLDANRFAAAAKKRGVNLGMGTRLLETLEELDRSGSLHPVLFELQPAGWSLTQPPSEPLFPEEEGFVDWSAVAARSEPRSHGQEERARPFYSWWQLLYVWDATDLGAIRVSLETLAQPGGFFARGDAATWVDLQRITRGSLDERWRGALLVLTRLQGRFGPHIKGRTGHTSSTMVFDPTRGAMVDPWLEERANFDAQEVLREVDLGAEQVKELHRQLAMRAFVEDPLQGWHPLSRMAPYSQRQRLKGAALRAQDGYDAADMLRLFYHELTSEILPHADEHVDLSDGSWRKRVYGGDWPALRFGHHHLVAQLRHRGLWPLQVHLVLEGDSEEAACREIFGGLLGDIDLDTVGITVTNIEGVGNLQRQRAVFSLAKTAARWTLLICDREGDAVKDVEQLEQAGLLDPDTIHVWDRSFEEDNFSDEELVEAVRTVGRKLGVDVVIDATEVRRRYDDYRTRVLKNPRGFASFLLNQARDRDGRPVVVGKPELGRALGRWMLDDFEHSGQEAACKKRPFLERMLAVLRVT
jgi:hypothetical protein